MNQPDSQRPAFFDLLPEIYRYLDADEGHPLQAFTRVLEAPFREQERALEALYDNWFVETCQPWVLPYLATRIGLDWITDARQIIPSLRALIANAIRYRQSKGTAWVLERALADASGWGVEIQFHLPKPQMQQEVGTTAVNGIVTGTDLADPPAGVTPTRIQIRRLSVFPMDQVHARRLGNLYSFSPDGRPLQLYNPPQPRPPFGRRLTRRNQPNPLTLKWTQQLLEDSGHPPPFRLFLDNHAVPAESLRVAPLDLDRPGPRDPKQITIDPEQGLFSLPLSQNPKSVTVDYAYAAAGEVGGGPYNRSEASALTGVTWEAMVSRAFTEEKGQKFKTLASAIAAWRETDQPGKIRILDNGNYSLSSVPKPLTLHQSLHISAAPGKRPFITGLLRLAPRSGESGFTCSGMLWDGTIYLMFREPHTRFLLRLSDMTLIPRKKRISLLAGQSKTDHKVKDQGLPEVDIHLERCIIGLVRFTAGVFRFTATSSIIDGAGHKALRSIFSKASAPSLVHCRAYKSTIFGDLACRLLEPASETIFEGTLQIVDTQNSRARYCYFPPGENNPLGYHCTSEPKPRFQSKNYGEPAYAQLSPDCPENVSRGGEGGSEIGVYNANNDPFRLENLTHVLWEYTLAGFDPELVFAG